MPNFMLYRLISTSITTFGYVASLFYQQSSLLNVLSVNVFYTFLSLVLHTATMGDDKRKQILSEFILLVIFFSSFITFSIHIIEHIINPEKFTSNFVTMMVAAIGLLIHLLETLVEIFRRRSKLMAIDSESRRNRFTIDEFNNHSPTPATPNRCSFIGNSLNQCSRLDSRFSNLMLWTLPTILGSLMILLVLGLTHFSLLTSEHCQLADSIMGLLMLLYFVIMRIPIFLLKGYVIMEASPVEFWNHQFTDLNMDPVKNFHNFHIRQDKYGLVEASIHLVCNNIEDIIMARKSCLRLFKAYNIDRSTIQVEIFNAISPSKSNCHLYCCANQEK